MHVKDRLSGPAPAGKGPTCALPPHFSRGTSWDLALGLKMRLVPFFTMGSGVPEVT